MKQLMSDIERSITENPHGWTSVEKAQRIAAMIVALRPTVSIEIGVWAGKGLVAMALAHKFIGHGKAIGVDAYSKEASTEGQLDPKDAKFWAEADHEAMYQAARQNITKHGVAAYTELKRMRSRDFIPPIGCLLLRIDGNHGDEAFKDTTRLAPFVQPGGFMILDDLHWTGGAPQRAATWLKNYGYFRELGPMEDGVLFQRI